jgi:hypothetical protein
VMRGLQNVMELVRGGEGGGHERFEDENVTAMGCSVTPQVSVPMHRL